MSNSTPGVILQASTITFRRRGTGLEFCLITSIKGGRWGFPKGIIDPGETAKEAAAKEALEEAGLHGTVEETVLGQYEYRKWDSRLIVDVMLMHVETVDEHWEEKNIRQRKWCRPEEAKKVLHRDELKILLDLAIKRLETLGN